MQSFPEFDIQLIQYVQGLGEWLLPPMKFFTVLGYPPPYFIILVLLCWCWNYKLGIRLTVLVGFSSALNDLLKIIFRAPRPYMIDERVMKLGNSDSFGMPSGHAQTAAMFWGYAAARHKALALRIAALLTIFFIGASRVYLGVHSPTQVLAGWGIGFALLGAFMLLEQKAVEWWNAQKAAFQIFLILDLAVLLVLLAFLKLYFYRDAAEFMYTTTRTHALSILGMASMLAGVGGGGVLFTRKYTISVQCSWWKQLLKTVVALGTLAAFIYMLLFAKTLEDQLIPVSLFLSSTGLIMGLWISFIAPLLFLKTGLFERR